MRRARSRRRTRNSPARGRRQACEDGRGERSEEETGSVDRGGTIQEESPIRLRSQHPLRQPSVRVLGQPSASPAGPRGSGTGRRRLIAGGHIRGGPLASIGYLDQGRSQNSMQPRASAIGRGMGCCQSTRCMFRPFGPCTLAECVATLRACNW